MNIVIEVPDEILERAHQRGMTLERIKESMLWGLRQGILDLPQPRRAGCHCYPTSWHNTCPCGCQQDDTECRAMGCCGVEHP